MCFEEDRTMKYMKPKTEIVEFEGYISTSDYEGLLNSNNVVTDGEFPPIHGEGTGFGGDDW